MNEAQASEGRSRSIDVIVVALAMVASVAAVWFVPRQPLAAAAFGSGLVAFGALAAALALRRAPPPEPEFALPDWSVTVAAIAQEDCAVAVTDRAGRLTCANRRFEDWFGTAFSPPRLPVDDASLERLNQAARAAWRDGRASIRHVESDKGVWTGTAERSGRGEDFLVWRFVPIAVADPVTDLAAHLDGKLGRVLARAGFAAALVDPDGVIRGASSGFALRAAGDAQASLVGREFVSFLSQDEHERIGWAREGGRGGALTLFHIPVSDPDHPELPDPETTPSLMLLVDAGTGIGASDTSGATGARHLEGLLAQLPLGLAMTDRDGRLLFANPAFMRAAGRPGEDAPTYPTDLVVREDKGVLSDAVRRFGLGPAASGDIAVRLLAQPDEPVSLSLAGVRGLGEAAVLLGLNDSSEEAGLKRQIAQATKMQAVGQLAGGVAHDFNNVLTAILGTCDLMLMRHTPGDSDYDDIQQIRANSNRAASLTRQLLAFSRQQTLRPVVLQLPDVVTEVSQMLKRLIGEKIRLSVSHGRNLGPVRADPTQLEQVIVNLAVNARDAMLSRGEPGGELRLTTRAITPADVRALRNEVIPAGDYTALLVEDTGGGIPPEHLGKIWEPFFTTKDPGKGGAMGGTGLGLSTVYGIVKQSGGYIFADSIPGKGTCFSVFLPVHHVDPAEARVGEMPASAAPPASVQWAKGGRVLIVEDEEPVRMVAERALARAGYEVTTARDGEEGLEKVRDGGAFDVVVSDVVMPGMDGPAMVRAIREIAPAMPVLFMSGYAEEQLRKEIDIANVEFLPKPFSVQQISDSVAAMLGAGRAG